MIQYLKVCLCLLCRQLFN